MQFTAVHHVAVKSLIQRATGIHPVREQRTTQINTLNRPGFPGECFVCELRLPDLRL
ncbi:hypothetical protein GSC54_004623 [Salmonella enterica]|nr:hypothetical protein [Salmonella enterica]